QILQSVAGVERVQHAHSEIYGEFQTRLAGSGLDSLLLLKQEHAKPVETGVLQRKAVFRFIHPEAARSAGAGREEHGPHDDLFPRHLLLFESLEILNQISDSKISRIALAVISVFLPELKCRDVRRGDDFTLVAAAFEHGLDQLLVFPGEAAEKNGDF